MRRSRLLPGAGSFDGFGKDKMDSGAAHACQLSLKENTFERGSQRRGNRSANRNSTRTSRPT